MQGFARHAWAWSIGCALALYGCGGGREARWLVLERVEPSVLELGGTLRVLGHGFPAGNACEVRLDGLTQRPGADSVNVHARLRGRAVSDEQVEVALDEAALLQLGGRGTFEGELQAAFAVRTGKGAIVGGQHARFDLAQAEGSSAARDQQLRQRAQQLLAFAGIVAADEETTQSGLVVAYARAGSPGALLGLQRGDVIAQAAGVRVHSLTDLAPAPHAQRMALSIERPGQSRALSLTLSLRGLYAPDLSAELARLSALFAWLLTCVLLLAPMPALARWYARGLWRLRRARPSELGLWGGQRSQVVARSRVRRVVNALYAAVTPLSLSVLGTLLVWLEPAGFLAVRSVSLYLGLLALSIALTLMSDSGTLRERGRAALEIAGRMLVMGVLIACACALSGTRTFDGMVQWQGGWPVRWALLQKPALLLSFPLYVVYASRLGAATLAFDVKGRMERLLIAERVLTNVVLCALGAAIFLGGWQSPFEFEFEGIEPRLLGAALFVGKTWCLAWLLSVTRRAGWGERLRTRTVALGCVATVTLTALWIWLEPPFALELALGRALGVSLLALWLVTALRVTEARSQTH